MQTSYPRKSLRSIQNIVILSLRRVLRADTKDLLSCVAALLLTTTANAQTLARPGWAGSGLAPDTWWRTAIFYRIDVPHFQSSTAQPTGDLRGVLQRLDYLQSLGVDAIVLESFTQPTTSTADFDDLLREASRRHIRLILKLSGAPAALLAEARQALTRGAAGISFSPASLPDQSQAAALLRDLRHLADSFPGQRVLLSEPLPGFEPDPSAPRSAADLTAVQVGIDPDILRALATQPPTLSPLLVTDTRFRSANVFFAEDAAQQAGMNKILATTLLTSRGAASLRYGQELGLASQAGRDLPKFMQWTPTNITPPTTASEAATPATPAPPPPPENVYGAFKPYVAPKAHPHIVLKPATDPATGQPVFDPAALPGFAPVAPPEDLHDTNAITANVAAEDPDPNSLLNFYRHLSQLHHDNPSLRSGTPYTLDHDSENALVWLRRAPVGSRTAATVVIACNLGSTTLTLSLRADFKRLQMRSGSLRPLLASWTEFPTSQPDDHIVLPPQSVYIAELYHSTR